MGLFFYLSNRNYKIKFTTSIPTLSYYSSSIANDSEISKSLYTSCIFDLVIDSNISLEILNQLIVFNIKMRTVIYTTSVLDHQHLGRLMFDVKIGSNFI